ncbi:mechanosensitive ion channel family protein [Massilia sp. PWRC2]|uniref:mechanosensitive ion channel family protein n=1 Tax=Massilia sp. PWRC2 TaxID=2804626 RepID=UPI003CF68393
MTVAATIFVVALAALIMLKLFAERQLARLTRDGRMHFLSYLRAIVASTRLPFLGALSLLIGISQLTLPAGGAQWRHGAWVVVLVLQMGLRGTRIIALAAEHAFERQRLSNPAAATHLMLGALVARILLWSLTVLIMLDNLGFNISTLMASLGIGGIAVALAVQNILGDVFSSVSIALDKPFVIGDFIVVDDYMGTVEFIGMKTTRLRSLGGEQIIFSNSELLKNRIRNYKRMDERRVLFEFGIAFETPTEQVEQVAAMVKAIVSAQQPAVRLDRAHFKGYGNSALMFEVVYYVLDADYNTYMDVHQEISLAMLRQFREREIGFAYPTTTLHIAALPEEAMGPPRLRPVPKSTAGR